MSDNQCTRCGQTGHRASHCPWPTGLAMQTSTATSARCGSCCSGERSTGANGCASGWLESIGAGDQTRPSGCIEMPLSSGQAETAATEVTGGEA